MRIRIESDGKLPFWLAGNPGLNPRTEQSEVLTEQVQITRSQQEVPGADWEAKQFFDRGNQGVVYVAAVKWQFADVWGAVDFLAALAPNDPAQRLHEWSGNVWLREDKEGTDAYKEWLLPNAVVSLAGFARNGVRVDLTYRISAGGFGGAGTGTSTLVNLVASSAGFNGLRLTPAMISGMMEEAPAGVVLCFARLYVTPRGGDLVYLDDYAFGAPAFRPDLDAAGFAALIIASFSGLAATMVDLINTYFAAEAVSGGVEGGNVVVRQPIDAACDDIIVRIFVLVDLPYETIEQLIGEYSLTIEPEALVNLTATHLDTDVNLTANTL